MKKILLVVIMTIVCYNSKAQMFINENVATLLNTYPNEVKHAYDMTEHPFVIVRKGEMYVFYHDQYNTIYKAVWMTYIQPDMETAVKNLNKEFYSSEEFVWITSNCKIDASKDTKSGAWFLTYTKQ
jgi:hypothetical protein